jgi:hypothetical protein
MRNLENWLNIFPKENSIFPQECFYNNDGLMKKAVPFNELEEIDGIKDMEYFKTIRKLLKHQSSTSLRRGADLPFIGDSYFSNKEGIRIMMILQDSKAEDAMSVAFFGPLLTIDIDKRRYLKFREDCKEKLNTRTFNYFNFQHAKNTFKEWGISNEFLYLTDAKKAYEKGNPNSFDINLSTELIKKEIETTAPDVIIAAGNEAFRIIKSILGLRDADNRVGEVICHLNNTPVVSAPFMTGNGVLGSNKERFNIKSNKTKETLIGLYEEIREKSEK